MAFSQETINDVWTKGKVVTPNDPNVWRQDECGAWMCRTKYGDRTSTFGWEVDHINPVARGEGEALSNLRPLQWENNVHKQDGRLGCAVTAVGDHNVLTRKERIP